MTITMVTFGSPAFLNQRIRDILSLPYDRFGVVILLCSVTQKKYQLWELVKNYIASRFWLAK